jgi:hypothetical protein
MRIWTRNSIGYKVCEYPRNSATAIHVSTIIYDTDDWTVLSICVACVFVCYYFPIMTAAPRGFPQETTHLSQSLPSLAATT